MEKKTIDTLRVMLCGEIEDIAKQGKLSHESLDILKDLVETEKNLAKIEKYDEEKMEKMEMMKTGGMGMGMGMPMEQGYSQRKFYIDADYMPYGQSFAGGGASYMDGSNYARAGQGGGGGNSRAQGGNSRMGMGGGYGMYDMGGSYEGGNSYGMYYDPRYERYARAGGQGGQSRMGGYARNSGKEEMVEELKELMQEATDEKVRSAIQEAITKMNK